MCNMCASYIFPSITRAIDPRKKNRTFSIKVYLAALLSSVLIAERQIMINVPIITIRVIANKYFEML